MDERLVAAYDYQLPKELIAQHPAGRRDASRLMLVRGDLFEDHVFSELPALLRAGDLLVLNETRVIPARLFAHRETGGKVEVLLITSHERERCSPAGSTTKVSSRASARESASDVEGSASRHCLGLLRPSKRIREGERLTFRVGEEELGFAVVGAVHSEGTRELELRSTLPFETFLERVGRLPLPPYIHNESDEAQRRYQTVFARVPGSIAAPTAALHFTAELLDTIAARGIEIARIVLDVGIGTFAPIRTERIDEHRMHAEHYTIPQETAERITRSREQGRRIVAVGTTVVRALEGCVANHGTLQPGEGSTSLFITPGFRFRVVDAMITNFHLPHSTLLMLVSAFAGRERIQRVYHAAIDRRYRFFSFGDAMLLEPIEGIAPVIPSPSTAVLRTALRTGSDVGKRMKAVLFDNYGDPDVLYVGETPAPVPKADEVLIRVEAAGVSHADIMQRHGNYPPPSGASQILGLDVAGVIEEVGAGATAWDRGDRVCALVNGGGYAELVAVPQGQVLPIPENWSATEATTLPENGFTVFDNMVTRARLRPGETVLVHGGASGIGSTAIMFARALGAAAIATAGSAEKCQACLRIGAQFAIDYKRQDFVEETLRLTASRGADVIIDIVCGDYIMRDIRALAMDGRIVCVAMQGGVTAEINIASLMHKRGTIFGTPLRPRTSAEKAAIATALRETIWPLLPARDPIAPLVDRVYTFTEAAQAHKRMEASAHVGKIVLIPL